MQAQQEGRYELAKHRYRQILDGPLLRHSRQRRQQQQRQGVASPQADPARPSGAALAGDELLEKMRYLATKNTAEVLRLEGKEREAGEAFAAATGGLRFFEAVLYSAF